ncbi:uncharacterized protein ATNIH1004_000822 [Aspergillus tanneri]|uniref:Glycine zipper 2TM domain-containing protein n=1 Tax=Aspergillus tanneri TaxID=1220188 RepID=A0A5M9N3Z3_9EURO|nr:uncharacterized protein ATNIH1004_000822 [Aspergillus tanneri]KAA8651923.1 hypothetical protein ATNIH1004_000822 [Aspergillus tanneri]
MSDPYTQSAPFQPPTGGEATYYAPPDSVYQNPPYDYDPHHQPYDQQIPSNHEPPQGYSQYDFTQAPGASLSQEPLPPVPPPQTEYLSPASAEGRFPLVLPRRGSNSEYYEQYPTQRYESEKLPPSPQPSCTSHRDEDMEGGDSQDPGSERSLGGAVLGGATGYYLGHKQSHGLLGAVGGR